MRKLRVGIDSRQFSNWGGGIDFIATIAEALESTGKVCTFLVVEEDSNFGKLWKCARIMLRNGFNIKKYRLQQSLEFRGPENLIEGFKSCSPGTKTITFKKTENRLINNREKKQLKCLMKNKIDILLPSMNCESNDFAIPRIGYIYDFQHKYLPELFSEEECLGRDEHFRNQLKNSKYLIVNAKDVKKDIEKYYPDEKCEIVVLPFKPFQKPEMKSHPDLRKYNLPKKYYAVCNQFWMHKSHITVFEALEHLYKSGTKDVHVVCTGSLADGRNPQYIDQLKQKISLLECKENIHLLGFIPKDDQIAIMKKSSGLIQPTLFEGGPGGGSTYNALCLGLTCLLSDIPVNKEVVGYDNVYFFEKKNSLELAKLMSEHINDKAIDEEIVNKKNESNRKEYGEYLLAKLEHIIKEERR